MTGNDVEDLLARYRPAGPPEALRARILRTAGADDRTGLPVWLAIAALAACVLVFVGGASRVYSTAVQVETADLGRERAAQIATTAAVLGGSPLGRELATDAITLAERDGAMPVGQRVEAGLP